MTIKEPPPFQKYGNVEFHQHYTQDNYQRTPRPKVWGLGFHQLWTLDDCQGTPPQTSDMKGLVMRGEHLESQTVGALFPLRRRLYSVFNFIPRCV